MDSEGMSEATLDDFLSGDECHTEEEEEEEPEDLSMDEEEEGTIGDRATKQDEEREERGQLHPMHYQCLTPQQLRDLQDAHIRQANEFLQVDKGLARIVLKHFKWDAEKLLERWMEKGKDQVFMEAGVRLMEEGSQKQEVEDQPTSSTPRECEICFSEVSPSEAHAISCGHSFCAECWGHYLTMKINEEGQKSSHLTCMGHNCGVRVDEATVEKLVAPEVFDKYMDFLLKAYVDDNPLLTWCPKPGCNKAIKITPGPTNVGVLCECGHLFCFQCGQESHAPATCGMVTAWFIKTKDGSENANWMLSHTKLCPQCGKPVEKNGGCNHISCPCGAHFCWMCNGLFNASSVYRHNCNAFGDKDTFSSDAAKRANVKLTRYLHYAQRFDNHAKSKELEMGPIAAVHVKIQALSEQDFDNFSWIDPNYLERSTKQLFMCREILKWTYVFAFFMFDPEEQTVAILKPFKPFATQKDLQQAREHFEFHQEELETTTERLSGMLERKTEQILQEKNYRVNLLNLTSLALSRFNAMFKAVEWIDEKLAIGEYAKNKTNIPTEVGTLNISATGEHTERKRRRAQRDEEEDLRRAIEASIKDLASEDHELQLAIQASLAGM